MASFLMGSNSLKFENMGDTQSGEITSYDEVQQTKIGTNELLYWDKEERQPKKQARIGLIGGPEEGNLYAKGQMQKAIASAIRKAGAKDIEVGAWLSVTYTGDGIAKPGMNAPKIYSAEYKALTAPF